MLHLLLCIVASVITNNSGIKKPFIVFGAHSKKNYRTLYKSGQLKKAPAPTVPFISHGKRSRTNSGHVSKTGHSKRQTRTKSKAKATRHNNPKLKITKKLSSNKRQIIPEVSGKQKKILSAKLQQQKAQELSQKKDLEKIITEKRQKKEKEVLEKEALKKEKAVAPKAVEEVKKIDSEVKEVKNEPATETALVQNENLDTDDDNTSEDDQEFDINSTSSTIVLNFGGKISSDMASYQKCIQQEVGRLWKPPLGVPRGTICRIGFLVDRKGKVQNFEIKKRSSVLIYDLSILRIAHLFKFDKKLWGKNFTVDFCQ